MIMSPTGNIKQIQTNLKFRRIYLGGRFLCLLIHLIDLNLNLNYDEISSHNYLQLNSQPQPVQLLFPVDSLSILILDSLRLC